MTRFLATRLFVLALLACLCATARAQTQPPTACPPASEIAAAQLYGLWRAEIEGLPPQATLLLEKHPTYPDSFSGAITRGGVRGWLSGEIEDGEFVLEESADGRRIAATWIGEVVEGSCGREIRGTWQRDGDSRAHAFILKKQ